MLALGGPIQTAHLLWNLAHSNIAQEITTLMYSPPTIGSSLAITLNRKNYVIGSIKFTLKMFYSEANRIKV